jgi:hypothetical protein
VLKALEPHHRLLRLCVWLTGRAIMSPLSYSSPYRVLDGFTAGS